MFEESKDVKAVVNDFLNAAEIQNKKRIVNILIRGFGDTYEYLKKEFSKAIKVEGIHLIAVGNILFEGAERQNIAEKFTDKSEHDAYIVGILFGSLFSTIQYGIIPCHLMDASGDNNVIKRVIWIKNDLKKFTHLSNADTSQKE